MVNASVLYGEDPAVALEAIRAGRDDHQYGLSARPLVSPRRVSSYISACSDLEPDGSVVRLAAMTPFAANAGGRTSPLTWGDDAMLSATSAGAIEEGVWSALEKSDHPLVNHKNVSGCTVSREILAEKAYGAMVGRSEMASMQERLDMIWGARSGAPGGIAVRLLAPIETEQSLYVGVVLVFLDIDRNAFVEFFQGTGDSLFGRYCPQSALSLLRPFNGRDHEMPYSRLDPFIGNAVAERLAAPGRPGGVYVGWTVPPSLFLQSLPGFLTGTTLSRNPTLQAAHRLMGALQAVVYERTEAAANVFLDGQIVARCRVPAAANSQGLTSLNARLMKRALEENNIPVIVARGEIPTARMLADQMIKVRSAR